VDKNYRSEHFAKVTECSSKLLRELEYEQLQQRYFFDQSCSFTLKTKTRLLVGFAGSGSVFEVSISLHPLYGFPVVPGSALKGLARSFCLDSGVDLKEITRMFGNEPQAKEKDIIEGEVVFLDAWPQSSGEPLLEMDIMTPHYGEYYGGTGLPSDSDKANPVHFLAVPRDVEFRFCLMPSRICKDKTIVGRVKDYLVSALKSYGVGAKTGSSYGYFR